MRVWRRAREGTETAVNDDDVRTDREYIDRLIADVYRAVEESREMRARQRVEAEETHRRMARALEELRRLGL